MSNVTLNYPKVVVDNRGVVRRIADVLPFDIVDVYSTSVYKDAMKGWHWYDTKTLAFTCLKGTVELVLYDAREGSLNCGDTETYYLSDKAYSQVVVPPGVWAMLVGIEEGENILVVCADEKYEHDKVHREPIEAVEGW